MKRLLERVLGRVSPDERKLEPDAPPILEAREGAASDGAVAASGLAGSRASVIQALRHQVAEGSGGRLRADEILVDGQLFDRGYLDSFSYVEFLAFIEDTYRVRIDDSQMAGKLSTIAAMAEHILEQQTPPTP